MVALYWTVLMDQIMYTFFRKDYDKFHDIISYPKFIGNCTGTGSLTSDCCHNLDPYLILVAINDNSDKGNKFDFERQPFEKFKSFTLRTRINYDSILIDSAKVMKSEIYNFSPNNCPNVNLIDLWGRIDFEFNKHISISSFDDSN